MLQYTYIAVAVIVVIGAGVLGLLMVRKARKAEQDELSLAMAPSDTDASGFGGADEQTAFRQAADTNLSAGPSQPNSADVVKQAVMEPAGEPDSSLEADVLLEIEHLLAQLQSGGRGAEISARTMVAPSKQEEPPAVSFATRRPEPTADPLVSVILEMLDGTGKLTSQELNRLDVFRPERIESAAESLELPPGLRDEDAALLRLAQIQLYAATLQLKSKWASQMLRPAYGVLQEIPFSARDFKLKMARDIMALPTPDRHEVTGYLLGGIMSGDGTSPELKRAVIETLEHLQSAALVNVLLNALDDPDPIVQEYALAAADRLLEG